MKKLMYIFILVSNFAAAQHTPLLSQYMFNSVALNPAFTGNDGAFSITSSNRLQWIGFDGAPKTFSLIGHAPLKKTNSAMGIQIFADEIGIDRKIGLSGSYSYKIPLNKNSLSLGLAGGINLQKSYFSRLNVIDQGDEAIMIDSPLGIMPDLSFGAHYYGKNYFASFSIPMMLTHSYKNGHYKVSNEVNNYNFMLGGGIEIKVNNELKIEPSILTKYRVNLTPQMDVNIMGKYKEFIEIGVSYRTQEAIVGLFKINLDHQISMMYSFGAPISKIGNYSNGSHELGLKYIFLYKSKIAGPRSFGW